MSPRSATDDETRLEPVAAMWLISLATAAFAKAAYGSAEQFVIAAFVLALPATWMLAATACTVVGLRRIGLEPYPLPDEARALAAFPVRVRVVNDGWWPALWLSVDFRYGTGGWTIASPPQHVPQLAPRAGIELTWSVSARVRGRWRFDGWEVRARFPGSLVTRVLHFYDRREQEVRSAMWKLADQAHELLAGRRRIGGRATPSPAALEEFVGLRDFRPGDDPRRIHLVSSLRLRGELAVREFEDSEHEDVCVVLDSAIPEGAADHSLLRYRLEKALCFSVALCRLFASRRLRVRFLAPTATGTIERALERGRPRDFVALEAQLAVLEPAKDSTASRALADARARSGARAIVFVAIHDTLPMGAGVILVVPSRQVALLREVVV